MSFLFLKYNFGSTPRGKTMIGFLNPESSNLFLSHSVGTQTSSSFDRDDKNFLHHTLVYYDTKEPIIKKHPVTITKYKPVERKY